MAKVTLVEDGFQEWLKNLKESFWGDLYGRTKLAWKKLLETESEKDRRQLTYMVKYLPEFREAEC